MQVEKKDINILLAYKNNQKKHSKKQIKLIARSIKEFGFINPIIINSKNEIIAGHARVEAAKEVGLSEVPVLQVNHLTDEQIKAYRIADNKLTELGEWDKELLAIEIKELACSGIDLEMLGLDELFLEDVLGTQKPFDFEIPTAESICKKGDLWKLGEHKLLCWDSNKVEDIKVELSSFNPNLVFTDPPYDLNVFEWLELIKDIPKAFIIGGDKQIIELCKKLDNFRHFFVLPNIPPTMISSSRPMQGHTLIAFFCKGKVNFVNRKDYFSTMLPDDCAKNYSAILKEDLHKQSKKVKVPEILITHYSKKNDKVLDCFGGAGSTLIACEKTGRKAFLIEIDEKYCDIIIKRYEGYSGKQAELVKNIEKTV